MSLVFTGIVPHPPILIQAIGKENLEQIKKTVEGMKQLERDLYASKPDILFIISPHGHIDHDRFTINISDNYEINFEEFGDFSTKLNVKGDVSLMTSDKERLSDKSPLNIISDNKH